MRICNRCHYTSLHPLYITFDKKGICSGCLIHEEKDQLEWEPRAEKLEKILAGYRNTTGNNYDCIIPVSGARDSYFIVHMMKNVYGMNPLLISYNKQYNTDLGIRNLANLRIRFNCDLITQTINPDTIKKITRGTIRQLGSIYWHCLAGQTVYPVQMAVKFKIPLIIWGAHQGVDQVGMFSHLDEVEMTRKYRKEHDLMGFEAEDMINNFDNITEKDISQFKYPDDKEIERIGVRGIYLNNYIRWDSKSQHEKMISNFGYETGPQTRTFDTYNDVDSFNYSDVHDYIKFLKYGYGKVTDHVCREIRLKRMTRLDGKNLIKEYSSNGPVNLSLFCEWLGIKESGFHFLIDLHRNPKIWRRNIEWEWKLAPEFFELLNDIKTPEPEFSNITKDINYTITPSIRKSYSDDKYILIGKGFYNQ